MSRRREREAIREKRTKNVNGESKRVSKGREHASRGGERLSSSLRIRDVP